MGFTGEIGLLSIDIDGNDYWIWKSIEVVQPVIVVIEYNSVFGLDNAITIPYKKDFFRTDAHYSNLYFGASLLALVMLGEEKGYSFVGSDSAGVNAYFVKNSRINNLIPLTVKEGYVQSKFRQSRDEHGNLTFLNLFEQKELLKGLPVINVMNGILETL